MTKLKWGKLRRDRRGFTLVELIVTLTILAILLGVAVGGMSAYQRYARYRKNNENARSIFNAAQAALTNYKASGRLESLQRELDQMTDSDGTDLKVPSDAVAQASTGRLYYLMLDQESGEKIIEEANNGTAAGNINVAESGNFTKQLSQATFDFLKGYITDTSIYDASICIEFDPQDGVVSGVLYCDRAKQFSYTTGAASGADGNGTMNITEDRSESRRKEDALGYYSAELSEQAPVDPTKITFDSVELVNDETLELKWKLGSRYDFLRTSLTYVITLYEVDYTEPLVTIRLEPDEVTGVLRMSSLDGGHAYLDNVSVTLHNRADASDTKELRISDENSAETGLKFRVYLDENDCICLTLDAMDAASYELLDLSDETNLQALSATYSARRLSYTTGSASYGLNLDADKAIYARIVAEGADYKTSDSAQSNSTNLLFADCQQDEETNALEYEITKTRHLANVRAREYESSPSETIQYTVTENLGWDGEEGVLAAQSEDGTYDLYFSETEYLANTENGNAKFPSVLTLKENHSLVGRVSGTDADTGVKTEVPATISGLVLLPETETDESGTAVPQNYVGLVEQNDGTISNLTLTDVKVPDIVTVDYVGALCGYNRNTDPDAITDVRVTSGSVAGGSYVGGILGASVAGITLGNPEIVGQVSNGATVKGVSKVGGVIGAAEGITIQNCTNTGLVTGLEPTAAQKNETDDPAEAAVSSGRIGGITGYAFDATVRSCVSAPGTTENTEYGIDETTYASLMKGNYVGGIVGYLDETASIQDCYTEGGTVLGTYAVGGLVGYCGGTLTFTEEFPEENRTNQANLVGHRYVGGIAGINARIVSGADAPQTLITDTGNLLTTPSNEEAGILDGWSNTGTILVLPVTDASEEQQDPAYIGGIAGVNYGTIRNCTPYETLDAETADYVGGMAGYNAGSIGKVTAQEDTQADSLKLSVKGRDFVGAVAGYNAADGAVGLYTLAAGSQITGRTDVGGILGQTVSANGLGACTIEAGAQIIGAYNVGGIAGTAGGTGTIAQCEVYGTILAQQGNAGGITASLAQEATVQNSVFGGIVRVGWDEMNTITTGISESINIGGIVGRNAGMIAGCSLQKKDNQVIVCGLTGNVGGIAGYNAGVIQNCNQTGVQAKASASAEQTSADYAVLIMASSDGQPANIGGIVGYNRQTGATQGVIATSSAGVSVDDGANVMREREAAAETQNWLIAASVAESNIGGIAGYYDTASAANVSDLVNFADIRSNVTVNAGGVIGTLANTGSSAVKLDSCANVGNVRTGDDGQAAGILAKITELAGAVTLEDCVNFGTVQAAAAAGILGSPSVTVTGSITLQNCVNTGDITTAGAGIFLAQGEGNGAMTPLQSEIRITNCRNYDQPEGNSSTMFAGIYGRLIGGTENSERSLSVLPDENVTIEGCFGVAGGIAYPIVPYASDGSTLMEDIEELNYYFDASEKLGTGFAFERQTMTEDFGISDSSLKKLDQVIEQLTDGEWNLSELLSSENRRVFYTVLDPYLSVLKLGRISPEGGLVLEERYTLSEDGTQATFRWYWEEAKQSEADASEGADSSADENTGDMAEDGEDTNSENAAEDSADGSTVKYEAKLYGIRSEADTVDEASQETADSLLGEYTGSELSWTVSGADSWSYSRLRLEVTRTETVTKNGTTTEKTVTQSQEYRVRKVIQLASIDSPSVEAAAENSFLYTISWTASEEEGCIGYQVLVKAVDTDGEEILLSDYDTKLDTIPVGTTSITVDFSQYTDLVGKTVSISVKALAEASIQEQSATEETQEEQQESAVATRKLASGSRNASLNETDETEAVLDEKDDAPLYLDAEPGTPVTVYIPVQLETPEVQNATFSLSAEEAGLTEEEQAVLQTVETEQSGGTWELDLSEEAESVIELNAGTSDVTCVPETVFEQLELTMTVATDEGADSQITSYLLCAGIYDSPLCVDGEPTGTLLSAGTLLDGETALAMEADGNTASYQFTELLEEYAGGYLFVRMKAASEQEIDSEWSDYTFYQLPEAELDTQTLEKTTCEKRWKNRYLDLETGVLSDVLLTHPVLTWEQEEKAGAYEIAIYALEQEPEAEDLELVTFSDEPTWSLQLIHASEHSYVMERALTEEEKTAFHEAYPKLAIPETYQYPVDEDQELYQQLHQNDDSVTKVYTLELNQDCMGTEDYVYTCAGDGYELQNICAELRIVERKDQKTEISLILPDLEEGYAEYEQYLVTQSVTVRAIAGEAADQLQNSGLSQWVRLYDQNEYASGNLVLKDICRELPSVSEGMLFTYPREQHKQEEADAKLGWTILPRRWGPIIRQEEKDETEAEEESELELELDLSIDLSDGEESDGSYYIYETDLLEDWQEEAIDEPASDADRTSETQSYSSIHETELIQLYMEGTTYE